MKILLIDDDKVDRMKVKSVLKNEEIVEASSGNAGMTIFRKEEFDCVLVDYMLADYDGIDLVHEMTSEKPDIPIIVITGQGDEVLAVRALKAGAQDYIPKSHLEGLNQAVFAAQRHCEKQALLKKYQNESLQQMQKIAKQLSEKLSD